MLTKTGLAEPQGSVHLSRSRLCYVEIKHLPSKHAPPMQHAQMQTEEKKQLNADFPQQTDTIF